MSVPLISYPMASLISYHRILFILTDMHLRNLLELSLTIGVEEQMGKCSSFVHRLDTSEIQYIKLLERSW